MNRASFILAIFLIITSGYARVIDKSERQFYKQGDWEFGFSANIGISSVQTKGTYFYSFYNPQSSTLQNTYENTEKGIYIHLGVSTGYYIINGLSIEPELNLNLGFKGFGVSILGNLCYIFFLPQKNIYPYVKLGYGLSNNPENSNGLFESLNYKTLNAGAGLKLMYFPGTAFRMEINYRIFNGSYSNSYSDLYSSSSNAYERTTSVISISLGISLLL
jgi:hypothetical protein